MSAPLRGLALVLWVVAMVVAIGTTKEWAEGQEQVAAADAAAARSDWPEAIAHARAGAEALAPGSPWPLRGWLRLEAVGHDAEARGDDATALAAYSAMRTAAMATRGLWSPNAAWETKAAEGLARVASSQRTLGPHVSAESTMEALRAGETPPSGRLASMGLASIAVLGGLGWLALAGAGGAPPNKTGRGVVGARVARSVAAVGFAVYAAVLLSR